jgi:hypothetical protein
VRAATGERISAHLLIRGFTFTRLTNRPDKPDAAWSPEQVADFALDSVARATSICCAPTTTSPGLPMKEEAVGEARHHREPSGAVALESRIQGGVRRMHGHLPRHRHGGQTRYKASM